VALGRAIVRQPKMFLFDEPLSNLDAALRASMRVELARLHRRLGSTIIYVTHDQAEALTLGEKIIVLHQGRFSRSARHRIFIAGRRIISWPGLSASRK
jgi:ABC-type sugar transport system ATPase subunit